MNPLLAVIPYHAGDIKGAKNLLTFIIELGGCLKHSCLLVADAAVDKSERSEVLALAQRSFSSSGSLPVVARPVGFPPNFMFLSAARHIMQCHKSAWLWLEPDCVPLVPGWLDALATEYDSSTKRFMGCLVESTQPGVPKVHLPGCSIYPPDAYPHFEEIESLKREIVAWDMESAASIVPRSANTKLIQHFWGKRNLPPTFVELKRTDLNYPENALDLTFLKPEAVLFHRNKDGTLLRLIQEMRRKKKSLPDAIAPKVKSPAKAPDPAPVNP
jgi:hypothetical protein